MKVLGISKWAILSILVLLSITGEATAIVNTCGKNLQSQPKEAKDCTSPDPDDGTCCFVQVQLSSNNTISYCSFVPGPYVKDKAIEDFKKDIPFPATVICNAAGFIGYSLSVLFVIFITLL
jgi:hypothetical protein